jgi:GTP pyrophosphokinase
VNWNQERKTQRAVSLRIFSEDLPGMLAVMSEAFHKAGVNISAVNCQTSEDSRAVNDFTILVSDLNELSSVISKVKKIHGVKEVERLVQ